MAQLALFALSIILPAVMGMGTLLWANIGENTRVREQELLATARTVSAAIDRELVRAMATNETLATSSALLSGDWATVQRTATRASADPRGSILLEDTATGRVLFDTSRGPARDDGPAVRAAVATQAQSPSRSRVSDLLVVSDRRLIAIATPASVDGARLNLAYVIDPAQFSAVIAGQALPEDAIVTVVDRQRNVVFRSKSHDRFVGKPATPTMRQAIAVDPEQVVHSRSFEGVPTVVGYTPSQLSGWTTLVVVSRGSFEAPLWRSLAAVALVTLLLLAIGAGAAWFYSRTISRELALLEADASTVGQGGIVAARPGPIRNFESLQRVLSEASHELSLRSERQRLMINELNHRVKNTLATVQSLAFQTFRNSDADARARFDTRLAALAAGHDLLTRTNWGDVSLRDVVDLSRRPHPGRIQAGGPDVTLKPHAALALSMCLHELITNSVKYGALSAPEGRVEVSWTSVSGQDGVNLLWREHDGPPVTKPASAGFGTRLIDRLVRHELGGEASRTYHPQGLEFSVRISLKVANRWTNEFGPGSAQGPAPDA